MYNHQFETGACSANQGDLLSRQHHGSLDSGRANLSGTALSDPNSRLAIMQPYLFPYLGYFQLIAAVDKFVIYDDVAFIKQGWVNRNRILVDGKPFLFTVPVQKLSSYRSIRDTLISADLYPKWKDKFLKTLTFAYSKAPFYSEVLPIIQSVVESDCKSIGALATRSITAICSRIGIAVPVVASSTTYGNAHLRAQERVLDICRREDSKTYINAPGGKELYEQEAFLRQGFQLKFINSRLSPYPQLKHPFVPALSTIDVLMFNPPQTISTMLRDFDLA